MMSNYIVTMKKVLTILLAASLMLVGTQAFAQLSANAGYINSTRTIKGYDSENIHGAYVGVSLNLMLSDSFGIAPGLYYSLLAGKQNLIDFDALLRVDGSMKEHALNLPVYLNYNFYLGRDSRFFIYAGPTLQYGLSSKVKGEFNSIFGHGTSTYDNYQEDMNRFNLFLGGGVGFDAGSFKVTVGYDYGMLNLSKDKNDPATHRGNLKIGIGFNF